MNRRQFLKSTAATASLAGLAGQFTTRAAEGEASTTREFYELRRYQFRPGPMLKRFEAYVTHAALPAMRRMGIGPVGVFTPTDNAEAPAAYVLIPFKSFEDFASVGERLQKDSEYQKAGAEYINATPGDPPYVRFESSLLLSFSGMPKLEVPTQKVAGKSRLFELRTYESHSKKANKKKVQMFNEGELAIFKRTGLAPVFFGEALIGPKLPNLTYLLVFDDMKAHDRAWARFGGDAEWKTLRATPGYTDAEIVSHISKVFLSPLPASQL